MPAMRYRGNQESVLGDLVTDAVRAGTGADVALINAGAMRLDDVIPPGPISNYQIESIFLFADDTRMVTFPLAGARLREVLEHGVSDASLGKGGFLQVSGVSLHLRSAQSLRRPAGRRDRAEGTASPIGPKDSVDVAFPAYPACHGGDGYAVPEAQSACAGEKSGPRAADLLSRYVTDSLKGKVEAPADGRITRAGNTNPG